MRRIALLFLVAVSLRTAGLAATRPRYGGTLRVVLQSAPNTMEMPSDSSPEAYWDAAHILALVADNLVTMDAAARPQPSLALAWQSDPSARHWQFTLRHGVRFHDGSAVTLVTVAQILGALHPNWNVRAADDLLAVDSDQPWPGLLAELALPRNLILKRTADGIPIGTGAFRVALWQPGKLLKLAANEESWSGRPFVDAVEIDFGKSPRDQAIALQLGRTDVIETMPSTSNGGPQGVQASLPVELMALVFPSNSKAQDAHLREALALATASVLPNWMTGYSAVFSTQPNPQRARTLLAGFRQAPLTLAYDPLDSRSQLIAERIALNAREVGITLQVSLTGSADIRLIRVSLPSPDPIVSLREAARQLGVSLPAVHGRSAEDLYQVERALVDGNPVIPLFHLPITSAASPRVHDWMPDRLGNWNLAEVWLEADSP
jgi:MarR-like DNA-binding transcriptional regulator SgrR of sgrS sRNA